MRNNRDVLSADKRQHRQNALAREETPQSEGVSLRPPSLQLKSSHGSGCGCDGCSGLQRKQAIQRDEGEKAEAETGIAGKAAMKGASKPADATSFSEAGEFEISSSQAYLRGDASTSFAEIKYQAGDLPTKTVKGEEVPDESFLGKTKLIPKGTKAKIDDVHVIASGAGSYTDTIKYVHVVGHGWTSVGNIQGGLRGHSVGVKAGTKAISNDPKHYTIGVVNGADVLKKGDRYVAFENKRILPKGTGISVEDTIKAYGGSNKSLKVSRVMVDGKETYTSAGNYAKTDGKDPKKAKITDGQAFEREKLAACIPDKGKKRIPLGTHVIIGDEPITSRTGSYVEIFAAKKPDTNYEKGESLGWTNLLNLTHGFHTDLKGKSAMWDQVIPDERYDRAKGKDTEGTGKFSGHDSFVQVVDSNGDVELVAKKIWPNLKAMMDAAGSRNLQVNTGFRSCGHQQQMIDQGNPANPVYYSSHQIGIAVDLNNKTDLSEDGRNHWMERNAWRYGFVKTYQAKREGHHWEYRPGEVVKPYKVKKADGDYMRYTFATWKSDSTSVWFRDHSDDKITSTPVTTTKDEKEK